MVDVLRVVVAQTVTLIYFNSNPMKVLNNLKTSMVHEPDKIFDLLGLMSF